MRVLVAEDDVRLAALLEQSLSEAGWEVEVVHDGRSAYVWRPMARLAGNAVEIRHPDPADGPDIVERYQRP